MRRGLSARLRRILPALALVGCAAVLLTLAVSAATSRELADEYCSHTNAAWCVDTDGDGIRESSPQLHPRFTEEGIEHLREKGRYFDPNDVVEADPAPTPTPTPTPTPAPTSRVSVTVSNLGELKSSDLFIGDISGSNLQRANGFRTGARSGGYTLVSISAAFSAPFGSPGNIVVAVHASSGGDPASAALVTLTGSNPATAGEYSYTCSGSCSLAANTDYFLVLSAPNATNNGSYDWDFTTSNNETNIPSGSGWSLADAGKSKVGTGSWTDDASDSGQFKIVAY